MHAQLVRHRAAVLGDALEHFDLISGVQMVDWTIDSPEIYG
jgi:hypothetical protein